MNRATFEQKSLALLSFETLGTFPNSNQALWASTATSTRPVPPHTHGQDTSSSLRTLETRSSAGSALGSSSEETVSFSFNSAAESEVNRVILAWNLDASCSSGMLYLTRVWAASTDFDRLSAPPSNRNFSVTGNRSGKCPELSVASKLTPAFFHCLRT